MLLALVCTTGCASSQQQQLEGLRTAVKAYNEAYRWKNYAQAASFLPPNQRPAFVASYEEDDKSLHIEGYQVIAVNAASPEVADVKVRYQFMQLPSVTLEKKIVTQHWARVDGAWILEHEDAPIRPIDPELAKSLGEGFGGGIPPEEEAPAETLEVEVLDKAGNVVRRRAEPLAPEPESPK